MSCEWIRYARELVSQHKLASYTYLGISIKNLGSRFYCFWIIRALTILYQGALCENDSQDDTLALIEMHPHCVNFCLNLLFSCPVKFLCWSMSNLRVCIERTIYDGMICPTRTDNALSTDHIDIIASPCCQKCCNFRMVVYTCILVVICR